MNFFLFLLLTGTLFVRPSEIVSGLATIPVYEILILACLATSLPGVISALSPRSVVEQPITACVLGMLPAIIASHISHGDFWSARYAAIDFSKVLIYFVLLIANVDSLPRLRTFLRCLLAFILLSSSVAALQYHRVINLPSLRVMYDIETDPNTGLEYEVPRLCSTGLFNDPNDLSMIVVLGIAIATYALTEGGAFRAVWLAPISLLGYVLLLTHSRGGLLSLGVGVFMLYQSLRGWCRAAFHMGPFVAAALLLIGGRQTDFSSALESDTGQGRIQFWAQGLSLLVHSPLFGIGRDRFADEVGYVAHNSFVHCYTELGLFGGTLFFGAFAYGAWILYKLGVQAVSATDAGRLRPYLLAMLAGYAVSLLSISRSYIPPTYLVLGIASSYLRIVDAPSLMSDAQLSWKLSTRGALASGAFVAVTFVFVRLFARWDVSV